MRSPRRFRRFRERLVLGPILRRLDGDEEILAWTHARTPGSRAPSVLVVTNRRCVVHTASWSVADVSTDLRTLSAFSLDRRDPEVVRVRLTGADPDPSTGVELELSLADRMRARSVGQVLSTLTRHEVSGPDSFDPAATSPLPPMERGVRHHARRVWITLAGALVLLLALLFSTPIVPGPGALTAVAGIAILAREYEWARDLHVWAARLAERFIAWLRRHRERWRDRRRDRTDRRGRQDPGGRHDRQGGPPDVDLAGGPGST
jgi:hypothetical protein